MVFFQMRRELIKLKLKNMKLENGEKNKRKDLKYETKKYIYDFQRYGTIRCFYEKIHSQKASIVEVEQEYSK